MRKSFLLPTVVSAVAITLSACGDRPSVEELQKYREDNCPLSIYNPQNLQVGDLVRIVVSGSKGQVIKTVEYKNTLGYVRVYGNPSDACDVSKTFTVRVNTHGIALDGGLWNSARPEVLPLIKFAPFELERWNDQE